MAPHMAKTDPKTALPRSPLGTRRETFTEAHATGLTIVLFGVTALALGIIPSVPHELRPIDLSSEEKQVATVERILKKPRMTLALPEPEADAEDGEDPLLAAGEEEVPLVDDTAPIQDGTPPPGSDLALVALDPSTPELTAQLPREGVPDDARQGDKRARLGMKETASSAALKKLATAIGASGGSVENPCVRPAGDGCARTALDPLFQALDDVADGVDGSHATVVTIGNSLIASDHVTDIVRARLVERFGDGGKGFLLPERLGPAGRRVRTGLSSSDWTVHTFAQKPAQRPVFGFTGSSHESQKKGDRVTWSLAGANHARLFYLDVKEGAPFRVEVDNTVLARVKGDGDGADKTLDFEIPDGAKKLHVVAEGPSVVLFGVALTKNAPGLSWDTIGVPASESAMFAATDEGIFTRQLLAREPNAVVVMMGGNEIRSLAFKWTTPDEVRRDYAALLDRVKKAAPDAACLAIAPIDAAKATAAGAELTTRKEVAVVVEIEREVAREKGCAFFDLFGAMGGDGSLSRFHREGLIHEDLVHPKGKGGDVLGQLVASALFESYVTTPRPRDLVASKRRIVPPRLVGLSFPTKPGAPFVVDDALVHLTDVLMGFGTADARRVAVGFFGDEVVADEKLTDRVRERLVSRYGDRGRGLVPFGPKDKALLRSRVTRTTTGAFDMIDGRRVVLGGAMGLSGQTMRLSPGARASVTFCDGCKTSSTARRGLLELTWLFTPDMGAADVYVNDVAVGVLEPSAASRDSDLVRLEIPVLGESHTVSIHARDAGGPVHVLAAAQETERPGVVVDAVGLAGTTGMTMQRWRADLIDAQMRTRDYDLVVTTWGANEAWIPDLDYTTYRHHFERSLERLTTSAPDADCVVVTPLERAITKKTKGAPPSADLVARVQKEVAAAYGCAHFSMPGAVRSLAPPLESSAYPSARKDVERIADLLVDDVLAWVDFGIARREQKAREDETARRETERALSAGDAPPRDVASTPPATTPDAESTTTPTTPPPATPIPATPASPTTLPTTTPTAPATTNEPAGEN
jgi:lysophospholipase L1-like esterase